MAVGSIMLSRSPDIPAGLLCGAAPLLPPALEGRSTGGDSNILSANLLSAVLFPWEKLELPPLLEDFVRLRTKSPP